MKKFVILALGLALVGCNEAPKGSTTAKLDSGATIHTVCLDGVEYWFREGNNAVLAPRFKSPNIGHQPLLVECTVSNVETNDAAVAGVIAQM